ncbi:hypothetical protein D3C73_1426160 [compost metagenome]
MRPDFVTHTPQHRRGDHVGDPGHGGNEPGPEGNVGRNAVQFFNIEGKQGHWAEHGELQKERYCK